MIRTLLAINDHRVADHISGLVAESDELETAAWLRDPQELRGALPRSDIDAIVMHECSRALRERLRATVLPPRTPTSRCA